MKNQNIPDSLMVNWDKTGSNQLHRGPWKCKKKIALPHNDDMRQMTFF